MASLEEQAIQAALSGAWQEAVLLNEQYLLEHPDHIDALNRLAYAYSQSGRYDDACKLYEKILAVEPYNPIAQKNLTRCRYYSRNPGQSTINHDSQSKIRISPSLFVADAQKTRIVHLVNPAPHTVLRTLCVGEVVFPYRKGFELHIRNSDETYLGTLPDDVGRKLMVLLNRDDLCECFVKDVHESTITIFIKWQE
ncbi:tetratricopeptide repeat protein [Candidatus Roizmanbacteria bacterium]|nr:tetratricopeptide repeat protein [Candidatus Roizmanbacteria bacterium]